MDSIELQRMGDSSSSSGLPGQGPQALTYPHVSSHDCYGPQLANNEQQNVSRADTIQEFDNDGQPSGSRSRDGEAGSEPGSAPVLSHPLEELLPTIQFESHVDAESSQPSLSFSPFSHRIESLNSIIRLKRDGGEPAYQSNVKEFGFKSRAVSSEHCELDYSNGKWYIRDIGSAGGTFLNGARLPGPGQKSPPMAVNNGDIIQLGTSLSQSQGPESRHVLLKVRCTRAKGRFVLHDRKRQWKLQMLEKGWCLHRIEYLADRYDMKLVQQLSELQPLRKEDHGACIDQTSCIAYNVNPATYRTRHVTSDCSCEYVDAPYEKIKRICSRGSVPLISIQQDSDSRFTIKAFERSFRSRYVAITHVWADGLGNPSACALPTCQIKKLNSALVGLEGSRSRLKASNKPILFWMDTLCIPVKDEDVAFRIAQIDSMASIYKGAWICLVLDAELMKINPVDSSTTKFRNHRYDLSLEVYSRVLSSVWMRYVTRGVSKRVLIYRCTS